MSPEEKGLDAKRIRELRSAPGVIGSSVRAFRELESTNDAVHRLAAEGGAEGLVVFADRQTRGRGRRGARWESRNGRDLLFSVLLRPSFPVEHWARLTMLAAVAVCRTLENFLEEETPRIKWPNDVYLHGRRKVCGILLETRVGGRPAEGYAVLGIGVNINGLEADFPEALRPFAISLRMARGEDGGLVEREAVAAGLLDELDRAYGTGGEGGWEEIRREAEARSLFRGEKRLCLRVGGGYEEGFFGGLGDSGELILEAPGGDRRVFRWADEVRRLD